VFAGRKITISEAGREPHDDVLLFGVWIAVCFQCPVLDDSAPTFSFFSDGRLVRKAEGLSRARALLRCRLAPSPGQGVGDIVPERLPGSPLGLGQPGCRRRCPPGSWPYRRCRGRLRRRWRCCPRRSGRRHTASRSQHCCRLPGRWSCDRIGPRMNSSGPIGFLHGPR
jgi:hypothetical protein